MKESEEKKPKNKQEFNRKLINEYIPYELWTFYRLRQYAELQAVGELDIIDHIMMMEKVSEQEAFKLCLDLLKYVSRERANIVEFVREMTSEDRNLDLDHFKNS